jgi:2-methylisocitrate lyase-like PEP mutase family enzyme
MSSVGERRAQFRRLHEAGCFVIPNPWDIGGAKYLAHLGYKALATTSAGAAWSLGFPDGAVPCDVMLEHIRSLVGATGLPVNADFEGGYAREPGGVAANVKRCIETGVAGLSIEDSTGDKANPLYDLDFAVARMRAARQAIDQDDSGVMLTGRAEGFIRGRPDLDEMIRRLLAYAGAGADCLYAPGITTREQMSQVIRAVAPKPVNILMGAPSELSVADVAALGARRISVGGALARAAWGGFIRAASQIAEIGEFSEFASAAPSADLNRLFHEDRARGRPQS